LEAKPGKGKVLLCYGQRLWDSPVAVPLISLLLSFLVIAVMAIIFGVSPGAILVALFEGALKGKFAMTSTVEETIPLALASLAVYLPYRAGFFNIGGQGQLQVGAIAVMVVVLNVSGPPLLIITLALLAAVAAGVLAVAVPLLLKVKRGANEVTTTIMMNFACIQFVYAMITGAMKDASAFYGTTLPVPAAYKLPEFTLGVKMHIGIFLAVLLVVATYWLLKRTAYGIQLKAVGSKPSVAQASGVSVNQVIALAVLGGAAFAGLAGGVQALGVVYRVAEGWSKSWGFSGIPIAFLAGNNPLAILPIAFLFAILETGARYMQFMTGVPAAMIYVFQGLPVLIYVSLNAWRSLKPKKVQR
jgi:simple sugar transport system permease protein